MPGVAELHLALIERRGIGSASRLPEFEAICREQFQTASLASIRHDDLDVHVAHSGAEDVLNVDGLTRQLTAGPASVVLAARQVSVVGDLFGESRLYWRRLGAGGTVVGQDLGAVARFAGPLELELEAVVDGLLFGVPADGTTYLTGIHRLAGPSSRLSVRADGRLGLSTTTEAEPRISNDRGELAAADFIDLINAGISESATKSLLLSGGLDSALLAAAVLERHPSDRLTALTFGADGSADVRRAHVVAKSLGLKHEVVEPSAADAVKYLPHSVAASAKPVGSPVLPAVMRRAREVSEVTITGEGADHVFGGTWFLRRAELYRRELVRRWAVLEPTLELETAVRKSRTVRDLTTGPVDERSHRMWRFELESLVASRCVSVMGGHASAAELGASFPYLNEAFVSFLAADPANRLGPYGWKPWLRRMAPALLPSAVGGEVLESPKTAPGQGIGRLIGEIDSRIVAELPPRWLAMHPVARLAKLAGEPFGAYQCAMFDLFVARYVVQRSGAQDPPSIHDLYADPATRQRVLDSYSAIERRLDAA